MIFASGTSMRIIGSLILFGLAMVVAPDTGAAGSSGPKQSHAEQGKELYRAKGCVACHSTDGVRRAGPSLLGVFGRAVEMQDGSKITVDENYFRQSLMEPQAKIVKGFSPSMPGYKGRLTDDEVKDLIVYLKSLKGKAK